MVNTIMAMLGDPNEALQQLAQKITGTLLECGKSSPPMPNHLSFPIDDVAHWMLSIQVLEQISRTFDGTERDELRLALMKELITRGIYTLSHLPLN
jgi:hypothetical protein